MSLLSKILGLKSAEPAKRIRICVECGMPVAQHKEWCSILRIQRAVQQRQAAAAAGED